MENFEKCTVAMLGGPCSQHVTGNTSRLYQPQSAIISNTPFPHQKVPKIYNDIPVPLYLLGGVISTAPLINMDYLNSKHGSVITCPVKWD